MCMIYEVFIQAMFTRVGKDNYQLMLCFAGDAKTAWSDRGSKYISLFVLIKLASFKCPKCEMQI